MILQVEFNRENRPTNGHWEGYSWRSPLAANGNAAPVVVLRLGRCELRYSCDAGDTNPVPWIEREADGSVRSLVCALGWCYRMAGTEDGLRAGDCLEMLDRHRRRLPPVSDDYSGNYLVLTYDAQEGRLALQPDRWAMQSVYYCETRSKIVAGNRSVAVAASVSSGFDGYTLLSMLRGVHPAFGRSLFAGVHRVLPGCYLSIDTDRGRLEVERGFPVYVSIKECGFREAVDEVSEMMLRMGRRLVSCGSAMFDLTGGNDTRITAAAVSKASGEGSGGHVAWRVSGGRSDPDVMIAAEIARLCRWPLLVAEKDGGHRGITLQQLQRIAACADGSWTIDRAVARIRQEEAYGPGWNWLVGSIGGELLRGFFWRHELLARGRTSRVNYESLLVYRLGASPEPSFGIRRLGWPSAADHDEVLLSPYRQIGELGSDRLNTYKLDVMYLHKLCYSAGISQSWMLGVRNARLPLVSWEVTRLVLSLPWQLRASRQLTLNAIERLNPMLANIPNDKRETMAPLRIGTVHLYAKAGGAAMAKAVPRILRHYSGLTFLGRRTERRQPGAPLLDVLSDSSRIDAIFGASFVRSVRREAAQPTAGSDEIRAFHVLATMDLILREIPAIQSSVRFDDGPRIR